MDCENFVIYKNNKIILKGIQKEKGYIYKYISYNKFEETATKIPKGYKKIKTDINIIRKYYCGKNLIIIYKDNEEYKKIKSKTKGFKHYFTEWNGGKPYVVYYNENTAYVYKYPDSDNDNINYYQYNNDEDIEIDFYIILVKKFKFIKMFVGKSPKNKMTEYSGGYGKKYDGNSLLFQITKNNYIFIGKEVYKFRIEEEIINYYSPIGNSRVPYPYIRGEKNMYLLLDKIYLSKNYFKIKESDTDAYDYYINDIKYNKIDVIEYNFKNLEIYDSFM